MNEKIDGNALKPGFIIAHQNQLWVVVKTQHTKPGKGGAFMQVELRQLQGNVKLNERFRANETVERVRLDEAVYQFLFSEGEMLNFMDQETFEQVVVPQDILDDGTVFLQEGMAVTIFMHEGDIVRVELPETVVLEVTEAEPVVKGQTATASYKNARLENGIQIMVPPHITVGTKVVVNTRDRTYAEKSK